MLSTVTFGVSWRARLDLVELSARLLFLDWPSLTRRDDQGMKSVECKILPQSIDKSQGRASKIILNGVSVARLTVAKPPLTITSRSFASPA